MYLIRRVIKVKPGTAGKAAAVLARIGKAYEESGQRSASRVYWSGGTVPGPSNMVYIDWTTDTIDTPSREGLQHPGDIFAELGEFQEESHLEFFEMHGTG